VYVFSASGRDDAYRVVVADTGRPVAAASGRAHYAETSGSPLEPE
jgi:hypothetical protein